MQRLIAPSTLAALLAMLTAGSSSAQPAAPATAKTQLPVALKLFTEDIVVGADGLATFTIHFEEQANNASAAQQLGQVPVRFGEATEDLDITDAYTLKSDGRKLPVATSAIYTQLAPGAPQLPMFDDQKQKVIVFPDVAAGDTVAYTSVYRQKIAPLPGQVMISRPFSRLFAYPEARVTLVAPKSLPLFTESHDVEAEKQDGDSTVTYRWHYSSSDPLLEDTSVLSAFDNSPRILVSSFKSYDDFAHVYAATIATANAVTPKIKAEADAITAGVTDRREQAKRIYDWVSQHIRYVGVEIGTGGLIPHNADTVLANGYGDCKDHVVLFSSLLKARGINSEFVLINLGNEYNLPQTPVVGELNHAITWIPELHLYADTTAGVAPFGVLPFEEYGKPVIHAVAAGAAVHQVPVLPAGVAEAVVTTEAHMDDKDHLIGQSQTKASGPFSIGLRQLGVAIQAVGPERAAAGYLQSISTQGTANFVLTPPTEVGPDYSVTSTFDLGPFAGIAAGRRLAMPAYFDFLGGPGETLIGPLRNTKIKDDDPTPCYSGHMVQDVKLDPPAGRSFYNFVPDTNIKTANLTYTAHWSLAGQSAVLHREITTHFDTVLCSGPVRSQTASAITQIRNELSAAVALTSSVTRPQAVVVAEPFLPAADFAPARLSYDVDGGKYREWRKDLVCPINSMQVTITVGKTSADPKWASLAQLIVNPPLILPGATKADPKSQTVSVWITARNGQLVAEMNKRTGTDLQVTDSIPFSTPVAVGKPATIFMSWKDDGTVLATLNKTESYSLHLDVPVTSVGLMASGTQADFDAIQAGQSGGAAGKCTGAANASSG